MQMAAQIHMTTCWNPVCQEQEETSPGLCCRCEMQRQVNIDMYGRIVTYSSLLQSLDAYTCLVPALTHAGHRMPG